MQFDIKEAADKGITVGVVGKRWSGKSTLLKKAIASLQSVAVSYDERIYKKKFPFRTVVCSTQDTWISDYKSSKRTLGIHHSEIAFNKNSYYYTKGAIRFALTILEDIPSRIRTPTARDSFEVMLESLISRSRKKGSENVFVFVSQFLSLIPEDVLPEISYYVFMQKGFSESHFRKKFPRQVCTNIRKTLETLGVHDYIVFDSNNYRISKPVSSYDVEPLVKCLCGEGYNGVEFDKSSISNGKVDSIRARVIRYHREHKKITVARIARELHLDPNYVSKIIWSGKSVGLVEQTKKKVSKFDKAVRKIRKNPLITDEELAKAVSSTVDSANVMKNKIFRRGLVSKEPLLQVRKEQSEKRIKEVEQFMKANSPWKVSER